MKRHNEKSYEDDHDSRFDCPMELSALAMVFCFGTRTNRVTSLAHAHADRLTARALRSNGVWDLNQIRIGATCDMCVRSGHLHFGE